jgi:hypothetical protein
MIICGTETNNCPQFGHRHNPLYSNSPQQQPNIPPQGSCGNCSTVLLPGNTKHHSWQLWAACSTHRFEVYLSPLTFHSQQRCPKVCEFQGLRIPGVWP